MHLPVPPSAGPAADCQEVDAGEPTVVCGAATAAHQRCLAHLTPDQLSAYLDTLTPGADIDARGVTFREGLLTQLLKSLRSGLTASLGRADFSGATFLGYATFHRVTFAEWVTFNDATFNDGAHFYRVGFREGVEFTSATFTKHVRFSRSSMRDADFHSARFLAGAEFLIRANKLALTRAKVSGDLTIEATASAIGAADLRGAGRFALRLRAARVDLSDMVFDGPVALRALQRPLDWDESGLADLRTGVPPVRLISLAGADSERLVLTDVDLTECRFAGMRRMDQLLLDGRCVFGHDPRGVRQILAEESYWRATRQHRGRARPSWLDGGRMRQHSREWATAPSDVEIIGPARLQVMYRQLRKAIEDVKNEPGAADFYYGEMDMRRAATTRPGEKLLLWLYWACSGYALRARRALTCLAVTVAAIVTALTLWGFPATGSDLTGHGNLVGRNGSQPITLTIHQTDPVGSALARAEQATEITLDAVIFRGANTQLTTAGRYVDLLARILGPLFLGLSALAIRNRVKR